MNFSGGTLATEHAGLPVAGGIVVVVYQGVSPGVVNYVIGISTRNLFETNRFHGYQSGAMWDCCLQMETRRPKPQRFDS